MPDPLPPFPEELTRVPGILGDATDWIEENSFRVPGCYD